MEKIRIRRSGHLAGTLITLGSVLFFTALNLLTKYLKNNPASVPIPSAQKAFVRALVALIIMLLIAAAGVYRVRVGNARLMTFRGLCGGAMVLLYFHAIDHTTLARATFFLYTYIAWGALFSYFFLKEPLGWRRVPGIALVYLGALLLLFGNSGTSAAVTWHGDLAGLASGLVAGMAATSMRALHRSDSGWMIFLAFCVFGTVASGGVTLILGNYVAPDATEWILLAAIGFAGTGAHLCLTAGFKYLDVPTVGALEMGAAPLTAVMAWLFLSEAMLPATIQGGVLLLAGGLYLALTTRAVTIQRDVTVPGA